MISSVYANLKQEIVSLKAVEQNNLFPLSLVDESIKKSFYKLLFNRKKQQKDCNEKKTIGSLETLFFLKLKNNLKLASGM